MAIYTSGTFTTENGIVWQLYLITNLSGTNNSTLTASIWAVTSKNGGSWWSADNKNTFKFSSDKDSSADVTTSLDIRTEPGNRKPIAYDAPAGIFSVTSYASLKYYDGYTNNGYADVSVTLKASLDINQSGSGQDLMEVTATITVPPKYPLPKPNQPNISYTTYNIDDKLLNNLVYPDSNYSNQTNTLRLHNIAASDTMIKYEGGLYQYSVFEIKLNKDLNLAYIAYHNKPVPVNTVNVIYGCIPYYTNTNNTQVLNYAVKENGEFKVGAYSHYEVAVDEYVKRIPKVELNISEKKIIISDVLYNKNTGADGYGLLPFKTDEFLPSITPTSSSNYQYPYNGYVVEGVSSMPASCYRIACNSSSNFISSFYGFTSFNNEGYIVGIRDLHYKVEDVTDDSKYIRLYNTESNEYIRVKRSNTTEDVDESDLVIAESVNPVGINATTGTTKVPSKCYIEFSDSIANYIDSICYKTNIQAELPVYYPELSGTSSELTVTWKKGNIATSTRVQVSPKNVMTSLTDNNNNKVGKVFIGIFNENEEDYVFNESEDVEVCRKNNLVPCTALTYGEYISMTET